MYAVYTPRQFAVVWPYCVITTVLLWHNQVRLTRSPRLSMQARMCYIMPAECKVFLVAVFFACFRSFLQLLFHDDVLLALELWDSFGFGVQLGRGISGATDSEISLSILQAAEWVFSQRSLHFLRIRLLNYAFREVSFRWSWMRFAFFVWMEVVIMRVDCTSQGYGKHYVTRARMPLFSSESSITPMLCGTLMVVSNLFRRILLGVLVHFFELA